MYGIIKDFAGPVATVIAAIAASYIAYRFGRAQMNATRERTVLDLFDRRWGVVDELRSAIASVLTEGVPRSEALALYDKASIRATLLFGPDVIDHLAETRRSLISLKLAAVRVKSDDDEVRIKFADIEAERLTHISEFFERLDRSIQPYMAMHQKLPA